MSNRLNLNQLDGQSRHLIVDGELDLETCPLLERRLQALGPSDDLRVDMSRVTFIDSTGLNLLLAAHLDHLRTGSRLIVVQPSPALNRLLDIARLQSELFIDSP